MLNGSLLFWATLAIALAVFYFFRKEIWHPLRALLRQLTFLARGESHLPPPLPQSSIPVIRAAEADIRRLHEMLQSREQQLLDEGFSLRAILSSMKEGVMIVDQSLQIRLANDALGQMFLLAASPINRPVIEVFRNHEIHEIIASTLKNGEAKSCGISSVGPLNSLRHIEISATALLPEGKSQPFGVIAVFRDITEIRKLEAVRREFVANVSHEFRTPLSIINGYIETLLDGALSDENDARHFLGVMKKNCDRLNLLIEDLLTISRMEHRSLPLTFSTISLRQICERAAEQLAPQIEERHATVEMVFPSDGASAEVDAQRMEQVFYNLLHNALQHGGRETLRIVVQAETRDGFVHVSVRDNGVGVPLEDLPHIFERFYRVRKDRARDAGGTGLGLSIVKHVIQAHGGRISVESNPGEGAVFHFSLPVIQNDGPRRIEPSLA